MPPDDTPPPKLDDEQIYCPACGYNLTGNLTGQCSECGSFFHREMLLQATRVSAEAMMPWERPDEFGLLDRFWRTLKISFFRPREFALAFAVQPTRSRSSSFYCICLLALTVNAIVISGTIELADGPDVMGIRRSVRPIVRSAITGLGGGIDLMRFVRIVAISPFFVLPIVTTNVAVGLVYMALYPHADRKRRLRPWRVIIRYAAPHWFLGWAVPILTLLFAAVNWDMLVPITWACTIAVLIGSSILWSLTLKEVVRWRTAMGGRIAHVLWLTLLIAWTACIATVVGMLHLLKAIEDLL
jgi:hypothetical protein